MQGGDIAGDPNLQDAPGIMPVSRLPWLPRPRGQLWRAQSENEAAVGHFHP